MFGELLAEGLPLMSLSLINVIVKDSLEDSDKDFLKEFLKDFLQGKPSAKSSPNIWKIEKIEISLENTTFS